MVGVIVAPRVIEGDEYVPGAFELVGDALDFL
jgi:hypothetical protein